MKKILMAFKVFRLRKNTSKSLAALSKKSEIKYENKNQEIFKMLEKFSYLPVKGTQSKGFVWEQIAKPICSKDPRRPRWPFWHLRIEMFNLGGDIGPR